MKSNLRWIVSAAALIALPFFWTLNVYSNITILNTMLYPGIWQPDYGNGADFNTWPATIFSWILTVGLLCVGIIPLIRSYRETKRGSS
jgi:hypothetical protein